MMRLFIVVFFLLPSLAFGGTYYVENQGSSSGNLADEGATAWSNATSYGSATSVGTAMARAVASDIVVFKDGTYPVGEDAGGGEVILDPVNSGSSGTGEGDGYITFKAENMLGAILQGDNRDGTGLCAVFGATDGQDYIIWDGFKVTATENSDGVGSGAVQVRNEAATNIILRNLEVVGDTHSYGGSNNYEGIAVRSSSYVTITNCYVHGFIESGDNHNTSGFKSYNSNNVIIEYSTFYNNTVNVYPKEGSSSHTVRYNYLAPPESNNYNVFYQTDSTQDASGGDWHNNIINSGSHGFHVNENDSGGFDLTNANIYNNTFYGHSSAAIAVRRVTDSIDVWNNISIVNSTKDQYSGGIEGNPAYMDYNSYWGEERWRTEAGSNTYTSLTSWQASGQLSAANGCNSNSDPDECSYYQNPQLSNLAAADSADDFRPTNSTPSTIKTGGRGSSYESYMGAWDPTATMWIGYCASDRYPSSTGNCDVYGTAGGDVTPPTVVITTSDPSGISADSLTVEGTCSDASGVSTSKWRIGSAPDESNGTLCSGTTAFTCSTSGYNEGANTLYVGCDDPSDNWGSDSITVNYTMRKETASGMSFNW